MIALKIISRRRRGQVSSVQPVRFVDERGKVKALFLTKTARPAREMSSVSL